MSWAAAWQAANLPGRVSPVRAPHADIPSGVAEWLQADEDTPVYAVSHVKDVLAFIRADSTRCLVQAFDGQSSMTALRRRLDDEDGPWQEQASWKDGGAYERHAADPTSGILLQVQFEDDYAGVLVERTDHRMLKLTKEQRAAWASTVVSQCAAGVHQGTLLEPESFAPFFAVIDEPGAPLEGVDGQPAASLALNSQRDRRACDLAAANGGVADLERAVVEALLANGAAQQPDGTYRVPKPPDARGHDAVFSIDRAEGPLEITVERP